MNKPLHYLSATELASEIAQKRVTSVELLDMYLRRIEEINPRINAVIHIDAERAREQARAADAALAAGHATGPLHGVPMTVKESFDVAGWPTTWGFEALRDNLASTDATLVARLRAAGAVIFGKTNMPVALADWQTYNPIHGTTNNPWDLTRTPGGSSGGAAAALATGLTGLEIGSDTGGSLRNPAHFCGIFSLKPSHGVIPWRGHTLPGLDASSGDRDRRFRPQRDR